MHTSKQKEAIHSMARGGGMFLLKWFSVVLCGVFAALGFYTAQPPYFMAMILPALIAYSAHQAGPHIRAASKALRSGLQREGSVRIEIKPSSESDAYYATVATDAACAWRFEFVPLGWTPVAGQMHATLYTLRGLDWPALIEVEGGVMYPRYAPKQVLR